MNRLKQLSVTLMKPLIAVLAALLLGTVIVGLSGVSPLDAYYHLAKGALGTYSGLANSLRLATPLIFTGLAFLVGFKVGVFNLGAEGQLYVGAFAAAIAGFAVGPMPMWLHVPFCVLVAAAAGALWMLAPAVCKLKFGANEIFTTLMMNYIALLLTEYLVTYPFRGGGIIGQTIATKPIHETAQLIRIMPPYKVTIGLLLALALTGFILWVISRLIFGYEFQMVGGNMRFANYCGIPSGRVMLKTMLLSGALAGIGGAVEVLGVHMKFMTNFSTGAGFDGIVASLMGRNHPIGMLVSALFLGSLKNGALAMERSIDIDRNVVLVLTAIIILFVTATEKKSKNT